MRHRLALPGFAKPLPESLAKLRSSVSTHEGFASVYRTHQRHRGASELDP